MQNRIYNYFSEAYCRGKLSHAYIIEGSEGTGTEQLADRLAAALLCHAGAPGKPLFSPDASGHPGVPCGSCPSCVKAFSGNHPDIIHVRHEKETVLSVGEIREQVVSDMAIRPYYGPYKIYIIPDARLMNENAQNALLKTIEEPAEYGIILLLTDNADCFLPTIRSRCIRMQMEPMSREQTVQSLSDEEGLRVLDVLQRIGQMDALQINKQAKDLENGDRTKALKLMRLWFRDLLVYKSTGEADRLFFRTDTAQISDIARQASFEQLNGMLLALDRAESQLSSSVKAEAVFESLLLRIRQNTPGKHSDERI